MTNEYAERCREEGRREAREMFNEDREEARRAFNAWSGMLARGTLDSCPPDREKAIGGVEEWKRLFGEGE